MISTRRRIYKLIGLALGCSMMMATPSYAGPITWASWDSRTLDPGGNTGIADGTFVSEGVTVHFMGNVSLGTQINGVGTPYWGTDSAIYTSSPQVDNPPPLYDGISLIGDGGAGTQTLTFSTLVLNPVMAILSLGREGVDVSYEFLLGPTTSFTLLNPGPGGFFDPTNVGSLTQAGNTLTGTEGHGLIQFNGEFNSIAWNIRGAENFHDFTVGIASTSVPEPASLMLLGAGLAAIGIWRRKAAKV